jgi:aspartate aminotransferase-like enzyme
VREALARDMLNHRGPEFGATLRECVEGLRWAFQTRSDVLLLTASGTGGLESVVVNTLSPGQKVLVVSIGYFGDRLAELARTYGAAVIDLTFPWGRAADPGLVAERLAADPTIDTVFVTHNETSTGVMNPLEEIARAVRRVRPEALLAVDGISSVGSVPILPDAWGCDVVVAGSQKGWMVPPGLVFVSVSPRAWERQAQAKMPRFYFDWAAHRKHLDKSTTPWTPAVGIVFALQAALRRMRAEGLEQVFRRHERVARYTRARLADLGLPLFADPAHASWTVTTAYAPERVDAKALLRVLREKHNVVLAGGQGAYEGKVLRIGHLGYVDEADIAVAIEALATELARLGAAPARVGS